MSVIEIHKLPNNRSTGAAAQLLCRSDLTGGRPVNSMLGVESIVKSCNRFK